MADYCGLSVVFGSDFKIFNFPEVSVVFLWIPATAFHASSLRRTLVPFDV